MTTPAPTGPMTITAEEFAAARAEAERIAAAAVQNALVDELAKAIAVNTRLLGAQNPPATDEDSPGLE